MFYFLSNSVKGDRSVIHIIKMGIVDFICALKSLKRRRTTSGDSHERKNFDRKQYNAILKSLILSLILLPVSAMYFFWIYIPLLIYSTLFAYLLVFFQNASKKNKHAKLILIRITGSLKIVLSCHEKLMRTKFSVMIEHMAQTFCDLVKRVWTAPEGEMSSCHDRSVVDFTELLAYEEREDEFPNDYLAKQKIHRAMHNVIPTNPFKATVRISRKGSPHGNDLSEGFALYVEKESPTSFPTTPFSRARIMNRSSDRASFTLFAARDRLRLEAQSSSKDEYSRNAALQARTSGQRAVFDPNQKSEGMALTCGNHCALKVGMGHCCSCRSMLPIRANTFIYLEFSVTVTGSRVPTLCVGLAPPDCPLNVMVGSWPRSVGLFSDGQLLVDSRWFPDTSYNSFLRPPKVTAGTTIGVLVYLQDASSSQLDMHAPESGNFDYLYSTDGSPGQTGFLSIFTSALEMTFAMIKKVSHVLSGDTIPSIYTNKPKKLCRVPTPYITDTSVESPKRVLTDEAIESVIRKGHLHVRWNINGHQSKYTSDALDSVGDIDSLKAPLYPTVSLLSEDTRVWCRFCEADIVFRDRAVIGAPRGARVYCLDGSLLFDEKD